MSLGRVLLRRALLRLVRVVVSRPAASHKAASQKATSHNPGRLPSLVALARQQLTPELGRFLLVGVSNTALSGAVYWLCLRVLPQSPMKAAAAWAVSYLAGIAWSFLWNRRWTFRSRGPAAGQAVRFTLLQLGLWLLSTGQIHLAVHYLGLPEWPSWVAVTGFITIVNFLGSRYWAFRERAGVDEGLV